MDYGKILKIKRKEKKIKQEELADGICNHSYLSRIENGHITPNDEIYKLLFAKLGEDFSIIKKSSNNIEKDLLNWNDIISKKNPHEYNINEYILLESNVPPKLYILFTSTLISYYIKINDSESAKKRINSLNSINTKNLCEDDLITYLNIKAIYALYTNEFGKILEELHNLTNILNNLTINTEKVGKFYYNISLCYLKEKQYKNSKRYLNFAIKYFSETLSFDFLVKCLINLAIIYNNTYVYEKSVSSYHKALKILKHINSDSNKKLTISIYNNLGYCYECQNDYSNAREYYNKAINLDNNNPIILINLARLYYKISYFEDSLKILTLLNDIKLSIKTSLQKELLEYIILYKKTNSTFDKTFSKKIAYLLEIHSYELVVFYAKEIAKLWSLDHFYKDSSILLNLALQAYEYLVKGGDK